MRLQSLRRELEGGRPATSSVGRWRMSWELRELCRRPEGNFENRRLSPAPIIPRSDNPIHVVDNPIHLVGQPHSWGR